MVQLAENVRSARTWFSFLWLIISGAPGHDPAISMTGVAQDRGALSSGPVP